MRAKPAPAQDEKQMNDELMKRSQDLTPLPADLTKLTNLVTKIANVLDVLIVTPGDFDACVGFFIEFILIFLKFEYFSHPSKTRLANRGD